MDLKRFMSGVFLSSALIFLPTGAMAADSDSWKVKAGGEDRFRMEYKNNFDLKDAVKDNAEWFYNRLRLNLKASYVDGQKKEKVGFFLEGMDLRASAHEMKGANAQKDDFDLHQAYVQAFDIADSGFGIKLGRQEFKYGAGRLLHAPSWSNRVRAFDGGILRYAKNGFTGDLLYGSDVKYDIEKFNMARSEEFVTGGYFTYQKAKTAPLLEWYYLDAVDIKGTTDSHRQTVGGRIKIQIAPDTDVDIEIPYQFGRTSGKDIHAYAFHADISKAFPSFAWKPKVSLAYDQASGDKNASDNNSKTFVPLYQGAHDPYGLLDIVRWQNIRNVGLKVSFSPIKKLTVTPEVNFLWLDNRHDAWYSSSGGITRAATAADVGSYVGTEVSIRSAYELTSNVQLEGGYAHLYTGDYLRDTSGGDDPINWFYAQTVIKF
jgi:hypothetical protein